MHEIELPIIHGLQGMSCEFLDILFEIFTFFGEAMIAIAVLAFFYWVYNKKEGQKMATVLLTSLMFNNTIKGLVKANRPFMDDPTVENKRESTATGYSFPSGHSQTAATLFTSLMLYFKKRWLNILLSILIFLVMLSRMYLGAHYPSDVIVGCLLGVTFAFVVPKVIAKYDDQKWLLIILTLIFAPFAIYFVIDADPYLADFFKMYGLLIGYTFAYMYERRFVNFTTDVCTWKKVLRFVLGLLILGGLQGGLKLGFNALFPNPSFFLAQVLNMVRYGIIAFVGLGLYPHLFKKLNF